jgi:iron complex transport system ATP-binding protein
MRKVKEFASGPDVVVVGVVHDLNLAARFADRLLLLDDGRILADGAKADVLTERYLRAAFDINPVLLSNPVSGQPYLAFE